MNKDIAKIIEEIDNILYTVNLVKNEPDPDWVNPHDYSSGYFVGRKNASRLASANLQVIKVLLEELNGKIST